MLPTNIVLDPRTQWFRKFLQQIKRPQGFEVPVEEARAMYAKGQELFPVPEMPVSVEERTIPAGPKGSIRLRIFKPENTICGLPVLNAFRRRWMGLGTAETYDCFMRELTHGTGAAVVFVEYSLSPEEHYPVPLEECYAAAQWISEHGTELGLDGGPHGSCGRQRGRQHGGGGLFVGERTWRPAHCRAGIDLSRHRCWL